MFLSSIQLFIFTLAFPLYPDLVIKNSCLSMSMFFVQCIQRRFISRFISRHSCSTSRVFFFNARLAARFVARFC